MEMSSDPILEAYTSRKIIVELDYGHFLSPAGWLNLIQIVCCFLSLCCCGSPTTISQGYFVVITSIALVGALIICLGHLKFGNFNCKAKITEYIYTFIMTMLCFTAFVAQLSELTEFKTGGSYWAIQLSAGIFGAIIDLSLAISLYVLFGEARHSYYEIQDNKT